jgi:hypothetical protein
VSIYHQPDKPLTEGEKLLAALVSVSQKIPCGGQICLGLNLDGAIERVEAFFTEHHLPLKDELLGELRLWREHAEQGLKFSLRCDLLMQQVIRLAGEAARNSAGR